GLPGVQAPQLHHPQEPAERPGPARADEVLPELPLPPAASRDPLTAVGVNADYLGRTYPATEPYEVCRVKIADFAEAIGDRNPLYTDASAEKAAGYTDVIAPTSFPIVITIAASRAAIGDPGLGINYAMVVHGEQRFTYSRPLHAGDVVVAQSTISGIREVGSMTMVTTETEIKTIDGEHVCTGYGTLVERGSGWPSSRTSPSVSSFRPPPTRPPGSAWSNTAALPATSTSSTGTSGSPARSACPT